jgi:protein TonB
MKPHLGEGLVNELFGRTRRHPSVAVVALGLALAGHAVAGALAPTETPVVIAPRPVEVEFLEPELAPPPPPAETPPPPVADNDKRAAERVERAPEAARAARLLTAKPDTAPQQASEEPVDFVSDPSGTSYGGGVVAIGGKADFGKAGARSKVAARGDVVEAGPKKPAGDGLVPASDLSRAPRLSESNPCRGFFPQNADSDSATASVMVVIAKSGAVQSARVVGETPAGQGFGSAARACMLSKRFTPALDKSGQLAATSLRVNVRFTR